MPLHRFRPQGTGFASLQAPFAERGRLLLRGRPLGPDWRPPPLRWHEAALPRSDFPLLKFAVPVFSARALAALGPFVRDAVEIYPVPLGEEDYYLVNVVAVSDCLDAARSRMTINAVTGHVSSIHHYAFREVRRPRSSGPAIR